MRIATPNSLADSYLEFIIILQPTVDGWMDDFIYPDPSPKRYAGYNNYMYPCMYK